MVFGYVRHPIHKERKVSSPVNAPQYSNTPKNNKLGGNGVCWHAATAERQTERKDVHEGVRTLSNQKLNSIRMRWSLVGGRAWDEVSVAWQTSHFQISVIVTICLLIYCESLCGLQQFVLSVVG